MNFVRVIVAPVQHSPSHTLTPAPLPLPLTGTFEDIASIELILRLKDHPEVMKVLSALPPKVISISSSGCACRAGRRLGLSCGWSAAERRGVGAGGRWQGGVGRGGDARAWGVGRGGVGAGGVGGEFHPD